MKLNSEAVDRAEMSVLGAMMLDRPAAKKCAVLLSPDDFCSPANSLIFSTMRDLLTENDPVDFVTVSDRVESAEVVRRRGGTTYLMDINSFVPSAVNVEYYADLVAEHGREYRLKKAVEATMGSDEPSYPVLASFIEEERARRATGSVSTVEAVADYLDELSKPTQEGYLLRTGLPTFDNVVGGLHRQILSCFKARFGVGKTAMTLNWMVRAIRDNHRALFVSLEMPKNQLFDRLASAEARIPYTAIVKRRTTDEQKAAISVALADLMAGNRLHLVDDVFGIGGIVAEIERIRPDIVFIDYIQKIAVDTSRRNGTRSEDLGRIASRLVTAAIDYNCHVCALSQINKLGDARDGGAEIEAASAQIFQLKRDWRDEANKILDDSGRLAVEKNRFGTVLTIPVKFIGTQQRFVEAYYQR